MSVIAPATEPRRPRRKKPQVPNPLYISKGHRCTIKGVPRVYLEDIERAYEVMEEYVPFSPSARQAEEHYQWMQSHYEEMADFYRKNGDEDKLTDLESVEIPRPIEIETSEYEPAYSIEELTSIPEKKSAELTMSVGYGDLRLRCTARDCVVSTNEDSPEAFTAYRQLVAILEPRVNHLAAMLLSWRFFVPFVLALVGVSIFGILARITILYWLAYIAPVLMWASLLWQIGVWNRRKAIVILQYRHEAPTFWEENWRRIATGIAITVGSAILIAIALRIMSGAWPDSAP